MHGARVCSAFHGSQCRAGSRTFVRTAGGWIRRNHGRTSTAIPHPLLLPSLPSAQPGEAHAPCRRRARTASSFANPALPCMPPPQPPATPSTTPLLAQSTALAPGPGHPRLVRTALRRRRRLSMPSRHCHRPASGRV
ncbi:uncharacterized protein BDZ99DRAFT_177699 [Mytilinidion resinicola]|uniref:Uncharacterized protein n=1 Tax=Mytilinidion resinicola TaxID=574789 RepID=A0A6A6Y2S2_9PEZI|nr:uncharacterized protein BDZ99DRAFT_177699 [Mytilinidion resinicola]KAF2802939.1 hypothetical protein BDZ99DRAFT_177699 [Mytilinidion resinicola]